MQKEWHSSIMWTGTDALIFECVLVIEEILQVFCLHRYFGKPIFLRYFCFY